MIQCSNCHCDIEKSKIILHERFCIENVKYCDICQEAVIKEEYEEHCQNHNKPQEEEKLKKLDSKEVRDQRSLERIKSSKIGCQYCGFMLGYSELEEHEEMCGARTTPCKICQKLILYKNLNNHILSEHGLNKSTYQEMNSGSINVSKNSNNNLNQQDLYNVREELSEFDLNRMTSDEQIAYAIALSEKNNINSNVTNNNIKNVDSKKEKKNNYPSKKDSKIDYDEIDDEYERQMYEEEMKNFEGDEEKSEKK